MNLSFIIFFAIMLTSICYRCMKDDRFYTEHKYIFLTGAASAMTFMLWLFIIAKIISDISG